MDFNLTEERQMLADTLARFLADKHSIDLRHEIAAADEGHSPQLWGQMAELGVIGALFSEADGGFGGSGFDIAVVFEEIGKALSVEPLISSAVLAGTVLSQLGTDAQKTLIEDIIAGNKLAALAHGEPASRYDNSYVAAIAEKSAAGYRLTGHKSVALGAGQADFLIVSARTGGDTEDRNGISVFLVDPAADGVVVRDYPTVDGLRAGDIVLNNVEVASDAMLGGEGEGFEAIDLAIDRATLAVCAEALGAMTIAKDMTVEYMHTRKQFGVIIGKFQALQHRMADILIELEQVRSSVTNAAGHLESEPNVRRRYVSAAKNMVGRIGRLVAEEAIQLHGGMAMTWEYPVGHYAKRIIMIDHQFGDIDHHLERFIATG